RAGEHHRGHRRRGGPHPAPRGAALAVPPDRRPRRRGLAGPEGGSGPDAHLRDPAGGPDALPSPGAVRNPGDLGRGAAVVRSLPEEDGVSELLLQTVDAGIEFGGLRALQGFNLEIRQGDLKGLIGPNGAGKTTAFNILTGVYQPTHGEIRVLGEMVNGRKPHQINHLPLARTFQHIRLFPAPSPHCPPRGCPACRKRPPSAPGGRSTSSGARPPAGGALRPAPWTRSTTTSTGGGRSSSPPASSGRRPSSPAGRMRCWR